MDYDILINTDGACIGNPGIIGIGGVIRDAVTNKSLKLFSESCAEGTSNEAEYLAIIRALQELLDLGLNNKKVLVCSDSEIVICQIINIYQIKQLHLTNLYTAVKHYTNEYKGKIDFKWIPRFENSFADALASKAVKMPQALIENDQLLEWIPDNYIPDKESLSVLPLPKAECIELIQKLNAQGNHSKFKAFINLKTNGFDTFSSYKEPALIECIEARFGEKSSKWLLKVLEDADIGYKLTALRWCARGLYPPLALKKASVDMEASVNIKNSILKKSAAYDE